VTDKALLNVSGIQVNRPVVFTNQDGNIVSSFISFAEAFHDFETTDLFPSKLVDLWALLVFRGQDPHVRPWELRRAFKRLGAQNARSAERPDDHLKLMLVIGNAYHVVFYEMINVILVQENWTFSAWLDIVESNADFQIFADWFQMHLAVTALLFGKQLVDTDFLFGEILHSGCRRSE
jgi:hypothetical protein